VDSGRCNILPSPCLSPEGKYGTDPASASKDQGVQPLTLTDIPDRAVLLSSSLSNIFADHAQTLGIRLQSLYLKSALFAQASFALVFKCRDSLSGPRSILVQQARHLIPQLVTHERFTFVLQAFVDRIA
jgi:hypothetical protein